MTSKPYSGPEIVVKLCQIVFTKFVPFDGYNRALLQDAAGFRKLSHNFPFTLIGSGKSIKLYSVRIHYMAYYLLGTCHYFPVSMKPHCAEIIGLSALGDATRDFLLPVAIVWIASLSTAPTNDSS